MSLTRKRWIKIYKEDGTLQKTVLPNIYLRLTHRSYAFLAMLLFILLFAIIPSEVTAQGGTWVERAETGTTGGFGEAVVGTGDNIYIIRAWSTGGENYFWVYFPSNNTWKTILKWTPDDPIPRPKSGTAMAWDGGDYIYVVFGAASTENRYLFYRYSISTNTWLRLADTPRSQGAGDAICWSGYDNLLYALLGSINHGACFARYDPDSDTWSTLSLPQGWNLIDDGASLVWAGGEYIYALRGEWEETKPHNDFVRYHIPTDTWEELPGIPVDNGVGDGASLLWVGNWIPQYFDYIFALGGNDVNENPGYGFYRYSISENNWMKMISIPYPVGYYVGNRLGFAAGHIYYWQGTPSTWLGGGKKFCRLDAPILGITKEDYPDPVEAGAEFTYMIRYSNIGDYEASKVVVTEAYSSYVEFLSADPMPDPGTNNKWTLETLQPKSSEVIRITVRVNPLTPGGVTLTNLVRISAEEGLFSNAAIENTLVAPLPPSLPPSYVGGEISSVRVNKLVILASYIILIGLAFMIATAVKERKPKKSTLNKSGLGSIELNN